jgi:hypothetical protein
MIPATPTTQCFDCGDLVRQADIACARCARPVELRPLSPIHPSNASLSAAVSLEAQLCIVFGALAIIVAPFLAWAVIGPHSFSGLDVAGTASLLLPGLGLLLLRAAILSMFRQRDRSSFLAIATILVAGALSWLHYVNLAATTRAQIGPGLLACGGGCLLLLIGVAGSLARRR